MESSLLLKYGEELISDHQDFIKNAHGKQQDPGSKNLNLGHPPWGLKSNLQPRSSDHSHLVNRTVIVEQSDL
jgi:hypothetical protein